MVSSPAPKHIPAWRKIGLKLKNATEESEEPTSLANGNTYKGPNDDAKRIVSVPPETEEPVSVPGKSSKKRKTTSLLPNGESATSITSPVELAETALQSPTTSTSRKRKSVTFSPETKVEDGDSVKQIYRTWVASQQASDPNFDASTLSPALRSIVPAPVKIGSGQPPTTVTGAAQVTDGNHMRVERKKRKKSQPNARSLHSPQSSLPIDSLSNDYVHPALQYLANHHTSPQSWKFNKAHQNYLIKHLFHLEQVPSSSDPALVSYLKGLASENTKARIRETALETRTEDDKWLAPTDSGPVADEKDSSEQANEGSEMGVERETPEQSLVRRLTDYNAAVEKMKSILEAREDDREATEWHFVHGRKEWEERLSRRRRAEVVLWGVGEVGEQVMAALQSAVASEPAATSVQKLDEQPAFRRELGPKRIKFGDEKGTADTENGVKPVTTKLDGKADATADTPADMKRKRKRKRPVKDRVGAIPDDESSSNDSNGNESDHEETKRRAQRKKELQERLAAQRRELERARKEVEEELSDETSSDEE